MLERLNNALCTKVDAKADSLGIDRRLLLAAVDVIAEARLNGDDLQDLNDLNGRIMDAFIKSMVDAFVQGSAEDIASGDKRRHKDATIVQEYLTEEQIEAMPTAPQVKNLLRLIDKPQRLHAIAIDTGLRDLYAVHCQYKPKTIAEVTMEYASEEIRLFYDSVSLRLAGVNESEIMRRLNTL